MKKVGEKLKKSAVNFYVTMILVYMPFYVDNAYFNMTYAKAKMLWIIGGISIIIIIIGSLLNSKHDTDLSIIDKSVLLFIASIWCSAIFGINFKMAFWGNSGWYMGVFTLTLLGIMYFMINWYFEWNRNLTILTFVSIGIIYLGGILNSFHIDWLYLHKGIENNFYDYIFTIGNVNWYVGLLSMLFPINCFTYFYIKDLKYKRLFIIYLDMMFYNTIICRSNGIFLSIIISLILMIYYVINHRESIYDMLVILLNFCMICGMVWYIQKSYVGNYVEIDSIFEYIVEKKLWLYMGIIIAGNMMLIKRVKIYFFREKYVKKVFAIIIMISSFLLALYEIYSFNDSWGTKRGVLWICVMNMFVKQKWKYKVFGCGCDCFGPVFMKLYGNHMEAIYLNAHNEFLQYLITLGVVGLVSFSFIWCSVIVVFFNHQNHSIIEWMLFSGLMGYFVQSIVNNPQALNYAVLFILLALFSKEEKLITEKNGEKK